MKISKWTVVLASAGLVSFGSVVQADEAAHQVLTAISSTTLSGYVSTSAIWNPGTGRNTAATLGGTGLSALGGSYSGGAKQDGFNLDVVDLTISKALDEAEWSAGYKAEFIAGPDASTFFGGGGEQMGVKQAYVELRAPVGNGLDFKLGVYDTPIGYEVFNAGENPNFTRSYGYGLEPTSYTGILTSYKFSDLLSAQVGVANQGNAITSGSVNTRSVKSFGPFPTGTPNETAKTYMALLTVTAPESFGFLKGSTLTAGAVDASPSTTTPGGAASSRVINYYAGGTLNTPLEGLSLGASFDYVGTTAQTVAPLNKAAYANSGAAYLTYKVSDKLKLNTRGEYYSGTSFAAGTPFIHVGPTRVLAVTETIDYSLWANVISRLELRWDHDLSNLSDNGLTGEGFGTAAGNLTQRNDFMVALNLIYKF